LSAFAAVDHQPQVFYAEPFLDQTILRIDHVLVIVFGNAVFMPSEGFEDLPWPKICALLEVPQASA
jgi:hypothetical protein